MKLVPRARQRAATAAEVDAALARLDHQPGMYFGVDAGIAGLHPLQAVLVDAPALAIQVHGNGLRVRADTALGRALLAHEALHGWAAASQPGAGRHPVASLRALLQAFDASPDVLLQGALRFNAHLLALPQPPAADIGVLFLAQTFWRRDTAGHWTHVSLVFDGLPHAPPDDAPAHPQPHPQPQKQAAAAEPQDDHPPGGHAAMVARALQHLRDKPLVSLTLSQSFRRRTTISAARAFARLRSVNPAPAMFFLNDGAGGQLFGASPDLQLVVQGRSVQALPVCGTVARRPGPVGEAESFRELVNEAVDAASLAVCTDALRNDLAPWCDPGSLRLRERRRQMSLATVVHTVDRLEGRLCEGADAWDAIVATTAPAMATGTPRALALAAIEQLEASPRGWYGGLAVQVSADGDALVGTLLRAAAIHQGVAEVRTGGDLMASSDPAREEQESRLKAISLWRALGLEASPDQAPAAAHAHAHAYAYALPAAVRVVDAGDAFPDAVRDTLRGLGLRLDDGSAVAVLLGRDINAAGVRHAVAIGDAGHRVLGAGGFSVTPTAPRHGQLLQCTATAEAPWPGREPFTAARYESLASASTARGTELPPGWQVWAHDDAGQPVMLAHAQRRVACLLLRPESLLSDAGALEALRAALVFCAAGT